MKINFTPQRSDEPQAIVVAGDILILNGNSFDFSGIHEGEYLDADHVGNPNIVGRIQRKNGILELTVIRHHGKDAPEELRVNVTIEGEGEIYSYTGGADDIHS